MDDFLHNLRSGKLKQADRSNRGYNDPQYKGGSRRNVMDRRKREMETFEKLTAVKEVLDTISETQKRMAAATEARTKAEERKARAMEILAQNIYRMVNPDATDADDLFATTPKIAAFSPNQPASQTAEPEVVSEADSDVAQHEKIPAPKSQSTGRLNAKDRKILIEMIGKMRQEGQNWEKIARRISAQGYPTTSGRGTWRGITAKTLFEKAAVN
jgi:hypothetical protein